MARQWTPDQRARQSKLIRQWKPWGKSTGPRTREGKAKAARNAYQGGIRSMLRELSQLLSEQRKQILRR